MLRSWEELHLIMVQTAVWTKYTSLVSFHQDLAAHNDQAKLATLPYKGLFLLVLFIRSFNNIF